jgi:hypothetical protein
MQPLHTFEASLAVVVATAQRLEVVSIINATLSSWLDVVAVLSRYQPAYLPACTAQWLIMQHASTKA